MELSINAKDGVLTPQAIEVLERAKIVPVGTPPEQISIFAAICSEKGLSPFSKEIYLLSHKNGITGETSYTPITSIEGFRKIANRGGGLAGCSDAKFDLMSNGSYKTAAMYAAGQRPKTCTVSVYKIVNGVKCEFTATIVCSEFDTKKQKWVSMFFQMAIKTAESHAIRKGFGGETSGVFVDSELGSINDEVPTVDTYAKPLMYPDHVIWGKAAQSIAAGTKSLSGFLGYYEISEDDFETFKELVLSYNPDFVFPANDTENDETTI